MDTSLDGYVGGVGMTLAGGYKSFFVVADFNYSRADLGFDDTFTAKIGSVRAGWQGKVGGRGLQTWLGAGNWDTAATAKGHVDLDDGRRLDIRGRPASAHQVDVRGRRELHANKHWQLFADFAADFEGGYAVISVPPGVLRRDMPSSVAPVSKVSLLAPARARRLSRTCPVVSAASSAKARPRRS